MRFAIIIFMFACSVALAQMPPGTMLDLQQVKRYPAITSGLVAYYRGDSDNVYDAVSQKCGTRTGSGGFTAPGKFSEASFSVQTNAAGTINLANKTLLNGATAYTIAFWIKIRNLTGLNHPFVQLENTISSPPQYILIRESVSAAAMFEYGIYRDTPSVSYNLVKAASFLGTNEWAFLSIGIVHGIATQPVLYLNGVAYTAGLTWSKGGAAWNSLIQGTNMNVLAGVNGTSDANISDICIYNRVLSAAENLTLYNGFVSPP